MTTESATAAGNAQLVRVLSICLTCILVAVVPGAALLQRGTGAFVFVGARDHMVNRPALGRRPIQPRVVPAGGAAAPPPPPPTCNLKINESAFAGSCTLLQDVCVDQVGGWAVTGPTKCCTMIASAVACLPALRRQPQITPPCPCLGPCCRAK